MNYKGESFRKRIKDRYESRYLKLADNAKKCSTKIARMRNHLKFLKRCSDNDIIPFGLRIKLSKEEFKVRNASEI